MCRCDNGHDSPYPGRIERDNIKFRSVNYLSLDIDYIDMDRLEIAQDILKLNILGKEYEMDYVRSSRTQYSSSKDEDTKKAAYRDMYRTADKKVVVRYRPGINEISDYHFYGTLGKDYQIPSVALTEQEVADMALDYLTQVYGEEYMSEYAFRSCTLLTGKEAYYSLNFVRKINDWDSGDIIIVSLYPDGTLMSFSLPYIGIYDNVEQNISKEAVEKAYKFMKETIEDETLTIQEDKIDIYVDYNGDYYLKVHVATCAEGYYINLNYFE